METKWIITGFLLTGIIISAIVAIIPTTNKVPISGTQGQATDFILECRLPESPATFPYYHVIKNESVFEGSPKVMEIKSGIPSEADAPGLAAKSLENYGGLPEDAVLTKVVQVFLEKYNVKTGMVEEKYPQFTQVIYEQRINGSPVVGPGAEINICLGKDGELLSIEKAWRQVRYSGEVPVISAVEAYEKLQKHDLMEKPQSSLAGITISHIKLGYYAEHRDHDQKTYFPVWIFYGSKQGGEPFPYLIDARR
jgi:hypothetical protein